VPALASASGPTFPRHSPLSTASKRNEAMAGRSCAWPVSRREMRPRETKPRKRGFGCSALALLRRGCSGRSERGLPSTPLLRHLGLAGMSGDVIPTHGSGAAASRATLRVFPWPVEPRFGGSNFNPSAESARRRRPASLRSSRSRDRCDRRDR